MSQYGKPPVLLGQFDMSLPEVMYYLYLPVFMEGYGGDMSRPSVGENIRMPPNVECTLPLILRAMETAPRPFKYVYLSARKGWATPDAPLNRPGWHCDGFGSDDLNFLWWRGPSTRFATGDFGEISDDHKVSMQQFTKRIISGVFAPTMSGSPSIRIDSPPAGFLYGVDPYVVHATPILREGCMRQYVKVSLSDHRYDLYGNSHNYQFDYDWPMKDREAVRNDTHSAQKDFA